MIAFGEEQQAACGFEIERFAAASERTDYKSAGRGERLFCGPQTFLALGRANKNETTGIEPKLEEARRVWGAILGEHAILSCPDDPRLHGPTGGKAKAEAQSRRFPARPGWTQLVQRLASHSGCHGGKTGRHGGWTRTHVLYMFYTPDSR